jgi:hypothetical protein
MTVGSWVHALDFVHHRFRAAHVVQRDVFGVREFPLSPSKPQYSLPSAWPLYSPTPDLPAYVIFHTIFAYIILAIGLLTLFLRLPLQPIRKWRRAHLWLGYAWIAGTIWIAVTALWCVRGKLDWDIIAFFIFSMYA